VILIVGWGNVIAVLSLVICGLGFLDAAHAVLVTYYVVLYVMNQVLSTAVIYNILFILQETVH